MIYLQFDNLADQPVSDRQGQPPANSYRYDKPDGTSGVGVSFAYRTDSVFDPTTPTPTDTSYNLITADGRNNPAPWMPFTRAGCDWDAVGTANTVLENIGPDVPGTAHVLWESLP